MAFGFILGCAKDKVDIEPPICDGEINYVNDVKEIIDNTCTFSDCHVSGNNVPGSFTNYNGLEPYLTVDQFEKRVLRIRDMPPNYSLGPKFLTEEQLDIISCWIEQEYPEN
jgi:hypothetical protein